MNPLRALPKAPTHVKEHVGQTAFQTLAQTWINLEEHRALEPFATHVWTHLWLKHFAPNHTVHVLQATTDTSTVGMAPFIERQGRLMGLNFRMWQSPSNEHSQRVQWALADNGRDVVESFWQTLREQDWEILLVKDVPEESDENQGLMQGALRDGFLVWQWPSLESPWLPLKGHEVEMTLKPKFRANLRRRRKKLSQLGEVHLERIYDEANIQRALDAGFRLEASGWKGQRGTAMNSHPQTFFFYQALAHAAAQRGWLALYLLHLGQRPVAFHFGLEHHKRYFLLKPGYDESLAECSPGQLLVGEVLRDLSQRGVEEFDFLGPQMPWKLDWTDKVRPACWTFIIRPSARGRLLYGARFHWGPRIKQWLREAFPWTT